MGDSELPRVNRGKIRKCAHQTASPAARDIPITPRGRVSVRQLHKLEGSDSSAISLCDQFQRLAANQEYLRSALDE